MNNWCNLSTESALETLSVNADTGLKADVAKELLETHGLNQLREGGHVSAAVLLLRQLKNPLLIILLIGAAVSLYADHPVDAIAIG